SPKLKAAQTPPRNWRRVIGYDDWQLGRCGIHDSSAQVRRELVGITSLQIQCNLIHRISLLAARAAADEVEAHGGAPRKRELAVHIRLQLVLYRLASSHIGCSQVLTSKADP